MTSLATIEDLQGRLDFPLVDAEAGVDLTTVAQNALEDLSEDALFYGKASWTADDVPPVVKSTIIRAAARHMKNPDGFSQSRSGDELVMWGRTVAPDAGSAAFTAGEVQKIQRAASGGAVLPSFGTMGSYSQSDRPGHRRSRECDREYWRNFPYPELLDLTGSNW